MADKKENSSSEKKLTPFDIVTSIRNKKKQPFSDYPEGLYNPFLTNRALSFDPHSLFVANEMNFCWQLPHKMQYDFFLNSILKRIPYSPWVKQTKPEDLDAIKKFYVC